MAQSTLQQERPSASIGGGSAGRASSQAAAGEGHTVHTVSGWRHTLPHSPASRFALEVLRTCGWGCTEAGGFRPLPGGPRTTCPGFTAVRVPERASTGAWVMKEERKRSPFAAHSEVVQRSVGGAPQSSQPDSDWGARLVRWSRPPVTWWPYFSPNHLSTNCWPSVL